ncbi:MAG: PAS domain-containing protein [Deltaproteobacteria bacterium]|nr:PAS domain-containing protein [Deltaproteobacteria bacterium]
MILLDDILKWFPSREKGWVGETTFSACPLPYVVCNKNFLIVAANPAFARFFKIPLERLKGKTLFQTLGNNKITLTADGKKYSQITSLSSVVKQQNPKILQGEFPKLGTRVFHVFMRMLPPNVLVLFQDITGAKELEDKISKSRFALLSIFDGIDDPMVMIGKDFRIKRINETMLKTMSKSETGDSYKNFIGKACWYKLHGRREQCPGCTAGKTFARGKKTSRMGPLQARKDAEDFSYQITCYPLKDAAGKIMGIAEGYRDITEIRRVEEELYESERSRIMEPLAAGIAHEIRNPLAIVRSTAQYCLGEVHENKDLKESLETIIRATENADRVVGDLLDFARPQQIGFQARPMKPLLEQVLRLIKVRAKNQKVKIRKTIPKGLLPIFVDEKRFQQALLNLLMNSLDAMPQGGRINLEVWMNSGGKRYHIVIRDTGKGVPEEIISKAFQPFYSTKKDGVGLGLPLAEAIIRSHGGRIRFKSWEGRGSDVSIELPRTLRKNHKNGGVGSNS